MLTILHAPQHMSAGLLKNLDTILALNPTIADLTEQDAGDHDNLDLIKAKVGHKYHVLSGPKGPGRARENVILVRKRPWRKITGVFHYTLSEFIPAAGGNPGIGCDRHMIVVEYLDWGRVKKAHVATHWNAVIQNKATGALLDIPRAQAMQKAGTLLEQVLRGLKSRGFYVTGGADFNFRDLGSQARSWRYAPHNIFVATRYTFWNHGLDYQWWTPNLAPLTQTTIQPGTQGNYSDHPWLLTTLKKGLH